MDRHSKSQRILDIYERLCHGKYINKAEEAQKCGVDERSIQRDIDDIRNFLEDRKVSNNMDSRSIEYDREKKGFYLEGAESSELSNSEILAVAKILLESRAFTKNELESILDKLIKGCVPLKNLKLVSDLISNEKYHYVELNHKSVIKDKLWDLGECVKEHEVLKIKYEKGYETMQDIMRIVEPVGLIFSEYYFYLNAYIVEKKHDGTYHHIYDYPAIFRLDRIISYKKMRCKFSVPYSTRFEEGEFRKRVQFMYAGELMKIQFKYFRDNPEAVLDRLPTARIVEHIDNAYIFEAEVYGRGIMMWLLSQGPRVEVIKPQEFREEMKKRLIQTLERY